MLALRILLAHYPVCQEKESLPPAIIVAREKGKKTTYGVGHPYLVVLYEPKLSK